MGRTVCDHGRGSHIRRGEVDMANKDRVGHNSRKAPSHDLKEKRAARREARREQKVAQHGKHRHRVNTAA